MSLHARIIFECERSFASLHFRIYCVHVQECIEQRLAVTGHIFELINSNSFIAFFSLSISFHFS